MVLIHFKRFFSLKGLSLYYALILALFLLLSTIFYNYSESLVESGQIRLGVVSQDTHALSQVLLDSFKNSPQFSSLFQLTFEDLDKTSRAFSEGALDAYVVIPEGFTEGLLTYESQGIQLYGHLENPLKNQLIAAIMSGYASYIDASNAATWSLYFTMKDAKIPSPEIMKANDAFSFEMIGATLGRGNYFQMNPVSELPMLTAKGYFALALPLGFICLTTLASGTQAIQQRKRAVHDRLRIAGTSYLKQLYSEQLAQWLYGLTLLVPCVIILALWLPESLAIALLGFMVAWWLWQCLWRLASTLTADTSTYVTAATSVAFFATLSSGGFVPYLMLPDWLKQLGALAPNTLLIKAATGAVAPGQQLAIFLGLFLLGHVFLLLEAVQMSRGPRLREGRRLSGGHRLTGGDPS